MSDKRGRFRALKQNETKFLDKGQQIIRPDLGAPTTRENGHWAGALTRKRRLCNETTRITEQIRNCTTLFRRNKETDRETGKRGDRREVRRRSRHVEKRDGRNSGWRTE